MNNLITEVTPLTRGVIWMTNNEGDTSSPHYQAVDYLLDGLLTAHRKSSPDVSSRVIVGQSFNKALYVMVMQKLVNSEMLSYETLLKGELGPENDILVIDDTDHFETLVKDFKVLKTHLRLAL